MRALFISRDYRSLEDGGKIVAKRNIEFLKRIFEQVDEILKPKAKIATLAKNYVLRESYGVTREILSQYQQALKENRYDLIWFDGSCDGPFIKEAKKRCIPTICFYHNIEYLFYSSKAKTSGRLLDRMIVPYIKWAEKMASESATYRILLNERDSSSLKSIYNVTGDFIMPTSFQTIDRAYFPIKKDKSNPYLLFVGSNFWANEEGLNWFFQNVAPKINIEIKIIGNICNAFEKHSLPSNVKLLGRVEKIDSYYAGALGIISPILSGSGTKTKTIEALRYGKTIIGSKEALMGVPTEFYSDIGFLCNNESEYIDAIKTVIKEDKQFNQKSLDVFNKIFSENTVFENLKSFINQKLQIL